MASELRVDRIIPVNGVPTGGGGGIIQVVQTAHRGNNSGSTSSYGVVSNYDTSITPTSSTSKILVNLSLHVRVYNNSSNNARAYFALSRDNGSSYIFEHHLRNYDYGGSGLLLDTANFGAVYLDSPATTSAVTYRLYVKLDGGTAWEINSVFGSQQNVSTLTLMEVSG